MNSWIVYFIRGKKPLLFLPAEMAAYITWSINYYDRGRLTNQKLRWEPSVSAPAMTFTNRSDPSLKISLYALIPPEHFYPMTREEHYISTRIKSSKKNSSLSMPVLALRQRAIGISTTRVEY